MLTNNNNAPGASIQPTAQTPMLKRVSRVGNLEIKTPEAAQAKPLKLGHSKCPVCGFFLAVDKLESHVNECLDHKPTPILKSNSSSTDSFDTLRPHTSTPTPGNLKLVVGASESTLYCVVCAKDISRFTTVARHNHVNACLDIGVTEILHAKPSKESKIALLEKCLFCSLVFPPSKTIKVKISHIKICSKKNRIPTEHLIGLLSSAPLLKRSRGETLLDFFQCDPQNQQVEPRASPKKVKFSKPVPARRDLLVFEAECSDDDFAPMQIVIDRAQKSSWPSSRQEKQDPNYQLAIAQSESLAMHHDKIDKAAMELAGPLFAEGQAAGEQSNTGKWFKKGKKPVISSLLTAKEAHEALAKKRMLLLGDGSPISEPLVSKQSIIVKESDSSVKRSRKSLWEVAGTPGIEDMPVPTFLAAYQSDSMDIDAQDSSENFKFTTPIVPQEKQLPESPCKEESCTPGPNELVNTTCNVETPDNLTIPPKIFTRNCDSVRLKPFRSSTGTPLVANSPLITSTSSRDTQASTTHSQLIELQSQLDAALAQVDILTVNIKNAHETHAAQLDEQHKRHEQESKETLKMFNMQLRSATDALMQSHERHLHVLREKHLDDLELLFDSIESEKQVIGERLGQEHVLMLEQQKELHEKKVASLNEQLTLEQTARNVLVVFYLGF